MNFLNSDCKKAKPIREENKPLELIIFIKNLKNFGPSTLSLVIFIQC